MHTDNFCFVLYAEPMVMNTIICTYTCRNTCIWDIECSHKINQWFYYIYKKHHHNIPVVRILKSHRSFLKQKFNGCLKESTVVQVWSRGWRYTCSCSTPVFIVANNEIFGYQLLGMHFFFRKHNAWQSLYSDIYRRIVRLPCSNFAGYAVFRNVGPPP